MLRRQKDVTLANFGFFLRFNYSKVEKKCYGHKINNEVVTYA